MRQSHPHTTPEATLTDTCLSQHEQQCQLVLVQGEKVAFEMQEG